MAESSLRKRYSFKLLANIFGFVISLITQALIPRALGPILYGQFGFLSNYFMQVSSFLDMGTSTCFYTKLSNRTRDYGLISFYVYFAAAILALIGFIVIASDGIGISTLLWPGQNMKYVYMAAVWGGGVWVVQVLGQMADAYGLTVPAEIARISQKFLGLLLIVGLYCFGVLRITQLYIYHYVILLFLGLSLVFIMQRKGYGFNHGSWKLTRTQVKKYTKEFYVYCHPLLTCGIVILVVGVLDRWLLQVFSGSVQQGFYSLAYQVGAVCFLFTNAMIPLLTREFAIANGKQDLQQMKMLFRRYIPLLYSVAAFFSCFVAVQAEKVIQIMGGDKFQGAVLAVAIMALYPIHQTYGQLNGSVYYATGRTSIYRNIGIVIMLIGLPVTYFLIAPSGKWGLDAGATGLAIKMLLLNVVSVNVLLYYNSKLLTLPFWRYVGHQAMSLTCFFGVASLAAYSVDLIDMFRGKALIVFLISGIFYTALIAVIAYFMPVLFGLKRQHLRETIDCVRGFFQRGHNKTVCENQ